MNSHNIIFGFVDQLPKNIDKKKVLQSLFYQATQELKLSSVLKIYSSSLTCLERDCSDNQVYQCIENNIESILSKCMTITEPICLLIEGRSLSSLDNAHLNEVAIVIDQVDPQYQDRIIEKIQSSFTSTEMHGNLVLQGASGKFIRAEKQGTLNKASKKHWKSFAIGRAPFSLEAGSPANFPLGWSAAAVVLSQELASFSGESFSFQLASQQVLVENNSVNFSNILAREIVDWWESQTGKTFLNIKKLKILSSQLPVSGCLLDAIEKVVSADLLDKFDVKPYVFGWNSPLSFVESILNADESCLVVDMTNFPSVQLVAVWK
jgi:hypothetical protein